MLPALCPVMPQDLGQQQVGGKGCAPGTMPAAPQRRRSFMSSSLFTACSCNGQRQTIWPLLCYPIQKRNKKKKKASKTKPKTTNPANLVLRQGKIKLFLFFKNPNEIMVLYGYLCHPRRMIPLRLKQRLLFANNLWNEICFLKSPSFKWKSFP